MKVLITGAKGQLGTELTMLLQQFPIRYEVYPFGRDQLDITNQKDVTHVIQEIVPDVIIHAAAYTKVDQAEADIAGAYAVNAVGTRNIAVAAANVGAKLVYISTDYVFDGSATSPYTEFDSTIPINVYGKSKRAGEEYVQAFSNRYFILRTSWVYGAYGPNFVKTMLKLGRVRSELSVVDDQIGSPTYTFDLAEFITKVIQTESYGIYHVTNSGTCSWFEFAKVIFEEAGINVNVLPCTTAEFPLPASRPAYSVMDHLSIRLNGFIDLRPWREALRHFLRTQ